MDINTMSSGRIKRKNTYTKILTPTDAEVVSYFSRFCEYDLYDTISFSFTFVISDKKAACFALGGALKARAFWILLTCEMECCTESNCNTQTPTLTQAAITVFTPEGNTKHSDFRNQ